MPLVTAEVSEQSVKFYMMFSYLRDLLESICILHYIVHIEGTSWEKKGLQTSDSTTKTQYGNFYILKIYIYI